MFSYAAGEMARVGGGLQLLLGELSSSRQQIKRTEVGGNARQLMPGEGEQSVIASRIDGDLDQSQGTDRGDA